jgi:hypothetical protein
VFAGKLERTALIRLAISSFEDANIPLENIRKINRIFFIITLKKK